MASRSPACARDSKADERVPRNAMAKRPSRAVPDPLVLVLEGLFAIQVELCAELFREHRRRVLHELAHIGHDIDPEVAGCLDVGRARTRVRLAELVGRHVRQRLFEAAVADRNP